MKEQSEIIEAEHCMYQISVINNSRNLTRLRRLFNIVLLVIEAALNQFFGYCGATKIMSLYECAT